MKFALSLLLTVFSAVTMAHGPTPQKVIESVEIEAPAEKVWAIASQFGDIAKWQPALKASEGGDRPGDKRTLTFPNGEQLIEELDAKDEAAREYVYRLSKENVKALPASSYSVTFKIVPQGKSVSVEWKSRLYRGDTGNFPADDMNDEAATKAMQDFFRSGLQNLKKIVEAGG